MKGEHPRLEIEVLAFETDTAHDHLQDKVDRKIQPTLEGLELPAYATAGAAGMDLRAAVAEGQPLVIEPGARALVPTGLKVGIPEGYEGQVRARSGLALRHGLGLPNAPGTIDSDYRGELGVIMANWGSEPFA